jgi:hypothetical protein
MTPSRAFLTSGVSVLIFMPGPAGMAQDATGLGLFSTCVIVGRFRYLLLRLLANLNQLHPLGPLASSQQLAPPVCNQDLKIHAVPAHTSTRHMRQLPATESRWW